MPVVVQSDETLNVLLSHAASKRITRITITRRPGSHEIVIRSLSGVVVADMRCLDTGEVFHKFPGT
jgi:hypothetical protein